MRPWVWCNVTAWDRGQCGARRRESQREAVLAEQDNRIFAAATLEALNLRGVSPHAAERTRTAWVLRRRPWTCPNTFPR
jgi:hypothetical protein